MTKPQLDTQQLHPSQMDPPPYSEAEEAQPVQRPESINGLPDSPVRGRNNSANSTGIKQPPPINESVTHSLNESQGGGGGVSPSLIAKITEQVLKEIEARKQPNTFIPPHFYPAPPPNAPLSPTVSVHSQPAPQRDVYTPPSPQRPSEFAAESPPRQDAPPRPDQIRPQSPLSQGSGGSRRASTNEPGTARPTTAVNPSSPVESEETTLEKIWGKLFEDSKPTEKLGQLLRGMAEYMIECYEPKNSLVVTPEKMQRYYRDTHISKEPYPWNTIFDDTVSCISRMYRDLGCEHHLVQEPGDFYVKPDIPGLTPRGFQQWASMMILAHPDEAFQRVRRIVRELPINNPDLRNERFPKELPRRLFPMEPNLKLREILVGAIEEHARVSIHRRSPNDTPRQYASAQNTPAPPLQQQPPPPQQLSQQQQQQQQPPPPPQPQPPPPEIQRPPSPPRDGPSEAASVSSETSLSSSIERERKPYSGGNMPPSCSIDDTNPTPNPPPLERVRKPYMGKEGEGRNFDMPPHSTTAPFSEDVRSPLPPMANNVLPPPRQQTSSQPPPPSSSVRRANSSSTRPINIPTSGPSRQRGEHGPPPAASATFSPNPRSYGHRASGSNGRRRAYSPPPSAPFRSSESDVGRDGMSGSFEIGQSWDGRDDGRRYDYRDDATLPPPPMGGRRDHGRGVSPGRRSSMYSEEDFYRPRRETTSGRAPW